MTFRERLALARVMIQSAISIFVLSFCGIQLNKPMCRPNTPENISCIESNEVALYWSGITSVLASWLPSPIETAANTIEKEDLLQNSRNS